jgi:hypothetical protein
LAPAGLVAWGWEVYNSYMLLAFQIIGLIVSGVTGTLAIQKWWHGRKRIQAIATKCDFALPPDIEADCRKFEKWLFDPQIEIGERKVVLDRFPKSISHIQPANSGLFNIRTVYHVEITNVGRIKIDQVDIDFPDDGFYRIDQSNVSRVDGAINLGPLRVKQIVNIRIWVTCPTSSTREFRVTYESGSQQVDIGTVIYGRTKSWVDFSKYVVEGCIPRIFGMLIGIGLLWGVLRLAEWYVKHFLEPR